MLAGLGRSLALVAEDGSQRVLPGEGILPLDPSTAADSDIALRFSPTLLPHGPHGVFRPLHFMYLTLDPSTAADTHIALRLSPALLSPSYFNRGQDNISASLANLVELQGALPYPARHEY